MYLVVTDRPHEETYSNYMAINHCRYSQQIVVPCLSITKRSDEKLHFTFSGNAKVCHQFRFALVVVRNNSVRDEVESTNLFILYLHRCNIR